jgi:hypothetical protein
MSLPSYLYKYFWDIDPKKAQPKSHPEYYIKRILELGDRKAWNWLKRTFSLNKIHQVQSKARLSPKAKSFWQLYLN